MRIDIITVLPELLEGPFAHSILKRAEEKGIAEVHVHQLRKYGVGKHQQVDDYQYGGGAGMVMQCGPLVNCIEDLQKELTNTDILIVATGAMEPTVYTKHFENVENNMLLLDLSVPRNIEPGIEKLNGVELIAMDQLNNIQDETLAMRRKNIPKARTIINLYKNEFYDWVLMRDLSPVIQALHEKLHRYRTDELEQQKFRLSDEEIKKADKLTTSVVNKIANQATEYIKSKYRHSEEVVKMMEEMFKLKQ